MRLLQLGLRQDGRQSVPADFGLAPPVIGADVAHALLVRVHVLRVVPTLARQSDLGQGALLEERVEGELLVLIFISVAA